MVVILLKTYYSKSGKKVSAEWLQGQPGVKYNLATDQWILECSTAGDINFSPFGAFIEVYGNRASIEEHFQIAKGFRKKHSDGTNVLDRNGKFVYERESERFMKAKGRPADVLLIDDLVLNPALLGQWYKLLWLKYLDANPDLVLYLNNFDVFNDCFSHGNPVNQGAVITTYIVKGRQALIDEAILLLDVLKEHKQKKQEEGYDMSSHL